MYIFSQTTCEGQEWSETSEEMLASAGCPAVSSWMSWFMTVAWTDRRAQHWRLIASNECHCSPQKRMNSGLLWKLQCFNPLWSLTGSCLGTISSHLKSRESFCITPVSTAKWDAGSQLSSLGSNRYSTMQNAGPIMTFETQQEFVQVSPFRSVLF